MNLFTPALQSLIHLVFQNADLSGKKKEPVTQNDTPPVALEEKRETKGTACVPCSREHFGVCASVLNEAMRFARTEGLNHREVMDRVEACSEELNAWERFDVAPHKLKELSKDEQEMIKKYLVRGRSLRHMINEMQSVDDLEKTAAEARSMATDFRMAEMALKGVDVGKVKQLAAEVQEGKKTLEEAKAELKTSYMEAYNGR